MAGTEGGAKRAAIWAGVGLIVLGIIFGVVFTLSNPSERHNWGRAGDNAAESGRPGASTDSLPALQPVELHDQNTGARAFTVQAPAGWEPVADIRYHLQPGEPMGIPRLVIRVRSPDGNEEFIFTPVAPLIQAYWSQQVAQMGPGRANGMDLIPCPNNAEECLYQFALPRLRSGLSNPAGDQRSGLPEASQALMAEAAQKGINAEARSGPASVWNTRTRRLAKWWMRISLARCGSAIPAVRSRIG